MAPFGWGEGTMGGASGHTVQKGQRAHHTLILIFTTHAGETRTFRRRLWVARGGKMWLLARGCALKEA